MFAIMTNWKTEFHKPLTRPGVKHDEEMSICSSTPQAHRGYINSSLLESDLKMSESHANVVTGGPDIVFDSSADIKTTYENTLNIALNRTCIKDLNENVLHYVYLTLF